MNQKLKLPLILGALLVGYFLLSGPNVPAVDVAQAATLQSQGAFLLDVREPSEFAEVHAKDATLIPLGQLNSRLEEIVQHKDKPVVVICRSGNRSARAVDMLMKSGFTQVSNVSGGTSAWVSAGLPVVKK